LRKLQSIYSKKKKYLLEKYYLNHLKDIKKNQKQKLKQLKEEQQKKDEEPPSPPKIIEIKPVVKEEKIEPKDLIIQRKIYPSISMCNPFIV
jgi:hypothetical protein